ncbi:MAG: hypothetical protein M1821_009293 [Bathelium mastoideum]|nr:MAG: hypothetical protein M1821_009293 [Bathelium mastoideum]
MTPPMLPATATNPVQGPNDGGSPAPDNSQAPHPSLEPGDYRTCIINDHLLPVIVVDFNLAYDFTVAPDPGVGWMPVLTMRFHTLHWVKEDQLMDLLDPREEMRADPASDTEILAAFDEAWQLKSLEHWRKMLMDQAKLEAEAEGLQDTGPPEWARKLNILETRSKKGKQRVTPDSPSSIGHTQADSDTPKKRHAGRRQDIGSDEDDEDEESFLAQSPSKKKKISTKAPYVPDAGGSSRDVVGLEQAVRSAPALPSMEMPGSSTQLYESPESLVDQLVSEPFEIVILVSREGKQRIFRLLTQYITKALHNMLEWKDHDGIHFKLQETDPDEFEKVAEYLVSGDWAPRLVDNGSRLQSQPYSMRTRQDWIQDCAFVWVIAKKLMLGPLQRLVLNKLLQLAPYTHLGILILARAFRETSYIETEFDADMKELLVDYISVNYKALERGDEREIFKDLMADDWSLSVAVADRMDEMEEDESSEDEDEEAPSGI